MNNYTLWGLFGPATWAWWLATLSLLFLLAGRRRWAVRTGAAAFAIFLLFAVLPTGYWLSEPLERRFPQLADGDWRPDAIVVLAGAENLAASARSGRIQMSGAGERIFEGARLARLYPAATLWIVGGVRDPRSPKADVDWTASAWRELGVAATRISVVDDTHDTCANAIGFARQRPRGAVMLVTSAMHMPRSVGCFRAAGVEVRPYPVDYQNDEKRRFRDYFTPALLANTQRVDMALHEWTGLAVYRARGRIGDLFPG